MNPEKIFTSLGISEYPASFVAFFSKAKKDPAPACDLDLIGKLEEEFHLFGQYIDPIRKAANQINLDPDLSFYVKAASLFAKDSPLHKARRLLPIPETDGSLKRNFLPLFVLIPLLPSVIENYRKRGFSEEEITHLLQEFQESIGKVKAAVLAVRVCGFSQPVVPGFVQKQNVQKYTYICGTCFDICPCAVLY